MEVTIVNADSRKERFEAYKETLTALAKAIVRANPNIAVAVGTETAMLLRAITGIGKALDAEDEDAMKIYNALRRDFEAFEAAFMATEKAREASK